MRVLLVNKFLYPRAGAESVLIQQADALRAAGHQVGLFGMEHPENIDADLLRTIPLLEFGPKAPAASRAISVARAGFWAVTGATRRRFAKAVEDFKPDLIHAHNIYNQLPPDLFSGVVDRIPVVMTVHDYKPLCPAYNLFVHGNVCERCLGGSFASCIENKCVQGSKVLSTLAAYNARHHQRNGTYLRHYTRYIAPSKFMKEIMMKGGIPDEKIDVIYNYTPPAEAEPDMEATSLLYFGRLCVEKGIDTLLMAYSRVDPAIRPGLRIAGVGPLESVLRDQVKALGLKDVEFLGKLNLEQVRLEITRAKLVVIPARWYENCPMSVLEAMALGRPVLGSDRGGIPELLQSGAGALFRAGDVDDMVNKLEGLLPNVELLRKMGQKGRALTRSEFSEESHMEKLIALYAALTGRPAIAA